MPDVLIVGAGPAGVACAETLRDEGFEGSILLCGREADPPYRRPPASKGYLAGRQSREDCRLRPHEHWSERDIDLRTRVSVMKLDPAARVARLSAGGEVEYERALIATGAMVRRLRVDGSQLDGIHYLRALGNADAIRDDVGAVDSVVLVGGSFIACEVAATLTAMGTRCTMVMLEERPLETVFGARVGEWTLALLREHGVEVVGGQALAAFEGADRVERVRCESGLTVEAGAVVMGTGAVPDVMLARSAGLSLGETGGVACDVTLATSAPGVWAAGDVCEYDSVVHRRRVRIEHWEAARAQGAHVARAMLGDGPPFAEVPYFWSDLADWASLEFVGDAKGAAARVDGDPAEGSFAVAYTRGAELTGYLSVNGGGDLSGARAALAVGG